MYLRQGTGDERISEAELAIECADRIRRFSEAEGAACFVNIAYDPQETMEQRLDRCASRYMEVASDQDGGRAVFIVAHMDMLALSICDSLCIPIVLGGSEGPDPSVGDCVWLYNWTPTRRYCGSPMCGRPISANEVVTQCNKCQQVVFCAGEHCAAVGYLMHHSCCSKNPEVASASYVQSRLITRSAKLKLPSLRDSIGHLTGPSVLGSFGLL